MTIAEGARIGKAYLSRIPRDFLVVLVLILASSASFGLGYLAGQGAGQGSAVEVIQAGASLPTSGQVVASKSGTKYFLPWCIGASAISDANKITFESPQAAQAAGYQPAGNCKGL